jgi:hypothetical protein
MRFTKTVNIWSMTDAQIAKLQPGQWVDGGGNRGQFWGIKPSGTVVVAWYHNAKNSQNYKKYNRTLLNYAQAA